MKYIEKYKVYSETSVHSYIVSKCDDGSYACSCLGWIRHYPRTNCKHILWVLRNKPEPLNLETYDKLHGKKEKVNKALDILKNNLKTSISAEM
jgi:hypothetical protein